MRPQGNRGWAPLAVTLIIVAVMNVLSIPDNSLLSSGLSYIGRGLFQLSAAAASQGEKDYDSLLEENRQLREENAKLREQLVEYYDAKSENERLWSYYGLKKDNPSYTIKPANVIMRDPEDDFGSFTLDIGSNLGVEINDPVITENGLVGRVSRVDAAVCRVKTILSPDTGAAVSDRRSGDTGILRGSAALSGDNLTAVTALAGENKVEPGDLIVTTGAGGVYPANLIVGKVREVRFNDYDASRYAVVEPYENIAEISSAAVVTDFDTKGRVVSSDESQP